MTKKSIDELDDNKILYAYDRLDVDFVVSFEENVEHSYLKFRDSSGKELPHVKIVECMPVVNEVINKCVESGVTKFEAIFDADNKIIDMLHNNNHSGPGMIKTIFGDLAKKEKAIVSAENIKQDKDKYSGMVFKKSCSMLDKDFCIYV